MRGGKRGLRMGLFDFLKKRNAAEAAEKPDKDEELERYTGLRAEVTSSDDGRLLFIAKLLGVRGGRAELHQQSGGDIDPETEALHVKIRGYSEKDKKAVYLQGMISPDRTGLWKVEGLALTKLSNERTFFRLDTNNVTAELVPMGRTRGKGGNCELVNISVGGACVSTGAVYEMGDQLRLTVKLHPEREPFVLFCQILRIMTRGEGLYAYGCRFVNLKEADEEKITQIIFDLQRKRNF